MSNVKQCKEIQFCVDRGKALGCFHIHSCSVEQELRTVFYCSGNKCLLKMVVET